MEPSKTKLLCKAAKNDLSFQKWVNELKNALKVNKQLTHIVSHNISIDEWTGTNISGASGLLFRLNEKDINLADKVLLENNYRQSLNLPPITIAHFMERRDKNINWYSPI